MRNKDKKDNAALKLAAEYVNPNEYSYFALLRIGRTKMRAPTPLMVERAVKRLERLSLLAIKSLQPCK